MAVVDAGQERRNPTLVRLLDDLGWSVSTLADHVNQELGAGYVSRTTASEWVNVSRVPRQPVPTVVAHVFSQARGKAVLVHDLWPNVPTVSRWLSADSGVEVSWNLAGTRAFVSDWVDNTGERTAPERRNFMALSGAALTDPAGQYVGRLTDIPAAGDFDTVLGGSSFADPKASPAILEYFRSLTSAFRRLDDREGGGSQNLRHVRTAFGDLGEYLKNGLFTHPGLSRGLVGVLAELSQIAGWMAVDADRHGLAQRYYRTGLQAAHNVGDRAIGAVLLACMSYQAAGRNYPRDATELATAAVKVADGAPPVVRALAMGRLAHAEAIAGNRYGLESAGDAAVALFDKGTRDGERPDCLYWLTSVDEIGVLIGQAKLLAVLRSQRGSRSQLQQAERLLTGLVSHAAGRARDACFHGAWLARAHVRRGDLHHGLEIAETTVAGTATVSSPRTVKVLSGLERDLATLRQGRDSASVRGLRDRLQLAIGRAG